MSAAILTAGDRLASPFLELLPIDGVSISVVDRRDTASMIHASDSTAARLEELHFELGEGPMFDCVHDAEPVLVADLATSDHWPVFLSRAADSRAAAVFVFPLTLGAASVGAALCYRTSAGPLDADAVTTGSALARAIAGPALRQAIALADDETPDLAAPIEMRREVHQATGMVLLQLDTTATDAFARMRAHAFAHGVSLREVAHDVVARRLDFSPRGSDRT